MGRWCDSSGAGGYFAVDGREYRLRPLRLVDWGEVEREMDAREEPFDEVLRYVETPPGRELAFWLSLRREQPDVTRDVSRRLWRQAHQQSDRLVRLWPAILGIPPHHSALDTPHSTFTRLRLLHGWTPQQISKLTLPQLLACLEEEPSGRRTVWMTPAEVRSRQAMSKDHAAGLPRAGQECSTSSRTGDNAASGPPHGALNQFSRPPFRSDEALGQFAQCLGEVRQTLRRLDHRDEVPRFAQPEES